MDAVPEGKEEHHAALPSESPAMAAGVDSGSTDSTSPRSAVSDVEANGGGASPAKPVWPFTKADVEILEVMAQHAAVALRSAQVRGCESVYLCYNHYEVSPAANGRHEQEPQDDVSTAGYCAMYRLGKAGFDEH
jgi:hypothetical protein